MTSENTRRFIAKAVGKYGRRYDYQNAVYIKSSIKVAITCRRHGVFWQTPNTHLSGSGCPACAREKSIRRSSTDEFIAKARSIHGDAYLYESSVYVRSDEKLIVTCREHGDFLQSPNSHLSGRGCPECGASRRSAARRKVRSLRAGSASRRRARTKQSIANQRWL